MIVSSFGNLPKLTVIMAVRNAVLSIDRALDSLAVQHYPKLEVIVWDGMSSDGTSEALARHSDIITTMVCESDSGPPDACNRALQLASGDYIGYLNADDELEPGMLWAVAEAILKNSDPDVVTTGIIYRTQDRHGMRRVKGYYADPDQLALTLENVLSELPTFMLSRYIKRDVIQKMGPWNTDPNLWYISNDREWMSRLALMRYQNVIVPHALYGFDINSRSISSSPTAFVRIIDEHMLIAELLLARTDLTAAQRQTVKKWQARQLAYGFWKAFATLHWEKAMLFARRAIKDNGWLWVLKCSGLLIKRSLRKLCLIFSNGIDSGEYY